MIVEDLSEQEYTISASVEGTGGSISDPGDTVISESEEKTYTITADAGYEIADVLVNDTSVGAVGTYTFEGLEGDATIIATFRFVHYTADHPFVFNGEDATLEAEHFILDPIEGNNYVRIEERAGASNGKEVNWFADGNKIALPFVAERAGTYVVTARYRSGRIESGTPNAFEWSGTNISTGTKDVYGEEAADQYHEAVFEINIAEVGTGSWVFTAGAKEGPVIDKFDIAYKPFEKVTGVSLDRTVIGLEGIGQTAQLTATVTPENAANKNVTWDSSEDGVVTVDADGLITSVGFGSAVVTVTTVDGELSAACEVEVRAVSVTGIRITPESTTLTSLDATVQLATIFTPANASNKNVEWSSSDDAIATVDSEGTVTAKGEGEAVITAVTEDRQHEATSIVTVKFPDETIPVTGISLEQKEAELKEAGETLQLAAAVAPENATNKDVTWTSSKPAVATVNASGLVTAVANGETVITVTTEDSGFKAACKVTVKLAVPLQKPAKVTGVTASKSTPKSIKVKWTKQAAATSYEVQYYNVQAKKWRTAGTTAGSSYTIKKLKEGSKYKVRVIGSNSAGKGEKSSEVKTVTKPVKVTKLAIHKAGANRVKLTWKKIKGSKYEVYMKTGSRKFIKVKAVGKPSWTQKKLKKGKTYTFKVRSYVQHGSMKAYGSYSAARKYKVK